MTDLSTSETAKKAPKFTSPKDPKYWRSRIKRRGSNPFFQIRFKRDGVDAWLPTGETSVDPACRKARDLWVRVEAEGLEAVISSEKKGIRARGPVKTVGDYIKALEDHPLKDRKGRLVRDNTVGQYFRKLRTVAAGVGRLDPDDKSRYAPSGPARDAWLAKIDAVPLKLFTPDRIEKWRNSFVATNGQDELSRHVAETSVASAIRNAKSLFRPDRWKASGADLGGFVPFQGVSDGKPSPRPYRAKIDAQKLFLAGVANAMRNRANRERAKALILLLAAGLRRSEADLLEWDHVDLESGEIVIESTEWFRPKSASAERTVPLPDDLVALLAKLKAKTKGSFVLEGEAPRRVGVSSWYRAEETWTALIEWLRKQGVTATKPLHSLRKEFGSLIYKRYDVFAAQRLLGHSSINQTASVYLTHKDRQTVSLGLTVADEKKGESKNSGKAIQ